MKEALKLAKKGYGTTSPNPMVGAVIVKNGKIVGKGYHKKKGEAHAEVIALKNAGKLAKGATLYVTLEPCCHYGTTPPCTKAIIKAGIKEVHTAMTDPSPWVNCCGMKELKEAGVKVVVGECEKDARKLNEAYFKYIETGLPFVILKAGITLDGKIADINGLVCLNPANDAGLSCLRRDETPPKARQAKWITSQESRRFVHYLRKGVDAIVVGIGTVIADNPELTVRLVTGLPEKGKNPLHSESRGNPKRIVLDSCLTIPRDAKVLGKDCIIATGKDTHKRELNAEIWYLPTVKDKSRCAGRIDLLELLKKAGSMGIQSIMVEGGSKVFTEFLARRLVDKVYFFIAPKILGEGIPVVGNIGIGKLEDALGLSDIKYTKLGEDILVEGYLH